MASSNAGISKAYQRSHSISKASTFDVAIRVPNELLPSLTGKENLDQETKLKQVEKLYRDHDLKALAERHLTSELQDLGGVGGVAQLLATDLRQGLGSTDDQEHMDLVLKQLESELALRRRLFGTNTSAAVSKGSFTWKSCREGFSPDYIEMLTRSCSIILLILGGVDRDLGWTTGFFLLVVQLIISGIDVWFARCLHRLLDIMDVDMNVQVQAIRCGRKGFVLARELVVGDLVELRCGDRIPADGLLVEDQELRILRPKCATACLASTSFLTSGSLVQGGFGLMLVTAVGKGSPSPGESFLTASDEKIRRQPALVHRLEISIAFLRRLKLCVSLVYMLLLLPFYFSGKFYSNPSGYFKRGQTTAIVAIYNLVNEFNNSLSLVTIVVPDTVVLAVTLSLVYFLRRMKSRGASIRNLEACETKLGFVTTVCTGKKNVLTPNEMDVQSIWIARHQCGLSLPANSLINTIPEDIWELLSEGVALNTTEHNEYKGTDSRALGNKSCESSALEKALLKWGCSVGMEIGPMRRKCTTLKMESFESEGKRSGVAIRRESGGKCVVHWKGAAEIILPSCSTWVCTVGGRTTTLRLSAQDRREMEETVASMGEKGLSCVALAYREGALADISMGEGIVAGANVLEDNSGLRNVTSWLQENDLTLLAMVGLKEKCRPEAKEAVKKAKDAGIRVIMVTADSLLPALAVAKESGIVDENEDNDGKVVDASTFVKWDVNERPEKLKQLAVLARASGSHQLQLVNYLQAYNKKEVIALAGDKFTDADALKEADVGFSSNWGTEFTKESADIVLSDNSFASMYEAIESARCMRCNVQHFLHFQLTLSFATALAVDLTTIQLQWVQLVTTLAAIALCMQPPLRKLMSQPPMPPVDEPLIAYPMWLNVAVQVVHQVMILGNITYSNGDSELQNTMVFNTFILCQVINMVNARQSLVLLKNSSFQCTSRTMRRVLRSLVESERRLLATMAVIAGAQIGLSTLCTSLLSTVPLTVAQWLMCVGLASLSWGIAIIGKSVKLPATPTVGIFSS